MPWISHHQSLVAISGHRPCIVNQIIPVSWLLCTIFQVSFADATEPLLSQLHIATSYHQDRVYTKFLSLRLHALVLNRLNMC